MMKTFKPWVRFGITFSVIYLVLIAILLVLSTYPTSNDTYNMMVYGVFAIVSPGFWVIDLANIAGLIDNVLVLVLISALFYFITGSVLGMLYQGFIKRKNTP